MTERGPEDVGVLEAWAPRGERFPSGKRWEAFCLTCKWSRKVGWKGEYRRAVALAAAHRCPAGDGGASTGPEGDGEPGEGRAGAPAPQVG
jgi:hypothetical protein